MTVISHNCLTCGAILKFNVDSQSWICNNCKRNFKIEELKEHIDEKKVYDGYDCENCGAEIVTADDELSTICAYCGSPAIIRGKIVGDYMPNYIVPFTRNKEDVINIFLKEKSKRILCPKKFFERSNIMHVCGVYVPYWLFSCNGMISIEGNCHDNRNNKLYIKRKASMFIDRIPADAKTKMNNEYLGGIEPFQYEKLKPFEYSYLAGFNAEKYDDNIDSAFESQLKDRILEAIINKLKNEDGLFYNVNSMKNDISIDDCKIEYALMPIWCIHVNYRGGEYKYYVNDQNQIISGKYPVSFFKETFLWLLVMILLGMTAYITLYNGVSEEICILWILVIGAWKLTSHTIGSYRSIKRNVPNREYIKSDSFKFIEYKDKLLKK